MSTKTFIISILTLVAIVIYFNIPLHKKWLDERVLVFMNDIHDDLERMDIEQRREYRWSPTYGLVKYFTDYMSEQSPPDTLLLMPPKAYCKKLLPNVIISEPVISYYFTGIRTTRVGCEDVQQADAALFIQGKKVSYMPINNQADLKNILDHYNTVINKTK